MRYLTPNIQRRCLIIISSLWYPSYLRASISFVNSRRIMDLTAKRQQLNQAPKESVECILEEECSDVSQPTTLSALGSCVPLHHFLCLYFSSKWKERPHEYTEDTADSRDSCSPTGSFSDVGSPVNLESPSDIHIVRDTECLGSPFAETHKQEVGQEMAFFMSPLVCCDVTDGGDQTDLPLWDVDIVLKVELWNTGTRRYMAKWQLSEGSTLLAEDVWLSGTRA